MLAAYREAGVKPSEPFGIIASAEVDLALAMDAGINRLEQKIAAFPVDRVELRRMILAALGDAKPAVLRELGWRRAGLWAIAIIVSLGVGSALGYAMGWFAGSAAALSEAHDVRAAVKECAATAYETQGGVACIIWKQRPPPPNSTS